MDLDAMNEFNGETQQHASQEQHVAAFNDDMERLANNIDAKRTIMIKRIARGDYTARPEYDLIGKTDTNKFVNKNGEIVVDENNEPIEEVIASVEEKLTDPSKVQTNVFNCDNILLTDIDKHLLGIARCPLDTPLQKYPIQELADSIDLDELVEAKKFIVDHMEKIISQVEDLIDKRKKLKDQLASIELLIASNER